MPVFIASDEAWAKRFKEKNLPLVGDDIKAQLGATITHRTLVDLFRKRGVKLERTYQLNTGGNTDFLNMLQRVRLASKKISKTDAVQSHWPRRPSRRRTFSEMRSQRCASVLAYSTSGAVTTNCPR
jgi:myo-inositol-1-phosphate synthase